MLEGIHLVTAFGLACFAWKPWVSCCLIFCFATTVSPTGFELDGGCFLDESSLPDFCSVKSSIWCPALESSSFSVASLSSSYSFSMTSNCCCTCMVTSFVSRGGFIISEITAVEVDLISPSSTAMSFTAWGSESMLPSNL